MLKLLKTMYALFGWHYPESIHKFYVINAPWIFRTIWAGFKVWLHPITVSKLDILGKDYMDFFAQARSTPCTPTRGCIGAREMARMRCRKIFLT